MTGMNRIALHTANNSTIKTKNLRYFMLFSPQPFFIIKYIILFPKEKSTVAEKTRGKGEGVGRES